MENGHAFDGSGGLKPFDHRAFFVRTGIALGGHHHAGCRARCVELRQEPGEIARGHAARGAGQQGRDDVIGQAHHQDLTFGIAKTHIEFNDFRAVRRDHQPDIQDALIGETGLSHRINDRRGDGLVHLFQKLRRHHRGGGVGAHAARVRALIAVQKALVILAGGQGQTVHAIGQDEDARLLARHEFLKDKPGAGAAESAGQHRLRFVDSGVDIGGDHHALARRQTVRLDDIRRAEGVKKRACGDRIGHFAVHRGRHAETGHEILGETLGGFQLRALGARSEHVKPARAQSVGQPARQRRLGTDHDEVRLQLQRQIVQTLHIVRGHIKARPDPVHGRTAGRAPDHFHEGALGDLPGQRMLAPARPDDEDVHEAHSDGVSTPT